MELNKKCNVIVYIVYYFKKRENPMGDKFKFIKRVSSITIVCLLVSVIFYHGSKINIHAAEYEKDNLSANSKINMPVKFKSFNEYVTYLKKLNLYNTNDSETNVDKSNNIPTIDTTANDTASNNSNEVNPDYGTTNIQVAGVDEADIIKNDGKHIYILNRSNNTVKIINPKPAEKMSIVGEINLQASNDNNYKYYNDMYLYGDKLVIIYNYSVYQKNGDIIPLSIENSKIAPDYYRYNKSFVCADIYDVSNKAKPKLERSIMNEGNLTSSRMVGSVLYLVANKFINFYTYDGLDPYTKENLLVSYSDSIISKDIKYAPIDSMYCVIDKNNPYYMQNLSIVSAVDITKNSELSISSFTGTGYNLYMSLNNIYLFGQSWDNNGSYTDIYKYKVEGTSVAFASSNKASGYMLNQFSADEFDGNLRIATTDWNSGNNVFVFDKDMKQIGQITGLAKGEQIKSCRFIGNKGYVVTYRTMDPLFVLDLSNGSKPVVTGELKIPGFSSYLHPVSENLIVGIGESTTPLYWRDENGKEVESGVKQIGVKISLFDVSNPAKPTEVKSITVGGPGSYTDVGYDHKSISFIKEKNLIAIRGVFTNKPVAGMDSFEYKPQALLISYKPDSLKIDKIFDGYSSYETGNRITYIGDTLYHFTGTELNAYNFNNYTKLGTIQYN